jgi:AcrR family transcriptional regulator
MAPKSVQTASDPAAGDPKHAVRATRSAGREMRSRLLDGASRLFRERGLSGTSISDIAAAADAFPSQITYYFRTKEALFVEAACRDMLYVAREAERAALKAHTPRDYTRALVESVTATDSVAFFAEALTLTRRRQDLAPLVERTIERLHGEGLRAYAGQIERHGWNTLRDPDATSRRFWAVAIGVMVEGYAMGRSPDQLCSEMLRVLGEQATTTPAGDTGRLRLVGERGASASSSSEGETSS